MRFALRIRTESSVQKKREELIWEKRKIIANWVAAIAIPLALGIGGYLVNIALKERESETKFIELAISVLSSEPKPFDDYRALRKWAVDVLETYSDVPIPEQAKLGLQNSIQLGGKGLKAEVGITLTTLDSRHGIGMPKEMSFGNLVTDALRSSFDSPKADFALITSSSFRGKKIYPPQTKLTRKDFLEEMPFSNSVTLISLSGDNLYKAIEETANQMGAGGIPQVSGLAIKYSEKDKKITIDSITSNGSAINPAQDYLIATTDFDAFGHVRAFANAQRIKHPNTGRHIYDIVLLYMYDEKAVAPTVEGRIMKSQNKLF